MGEPFGIYGRNSDPITQAEGTWVGDSLDYQVAQARQECQRRGYTVVEDYVIIEQVTGTLPGAQRDGMDTLIRAGEQGRIKGVMCLNVGRASRDFPVFVNLYSKLKAIATGPVRLEFVDQKYEGKFGEMMMYQQAMFADWERQQIVERFARGKATAIEKKRFLPGRYAPLGYRQIKRQSPTEHPRLEIEDTTKHIPERIFALVDQGHAGYAVARMVNAEGLRTRTGRLFSPDAVVEMIRNPVYRGEWVWGQYENIRAKDPRTPAATKRKTSKRLRPESEWHRIPVPAIVSSDLWQRANDRLDHNRSPKKHGGDNDYLLSDIIECVHCKGKDGPIKYYGQTRYDRKKPRSYYACSAKNTCRLIAGKEKCPGGYLPAAKKEAEVWDMVMELLTNPQAVADIYKKANEGGAEARERDERMLSHYSLQLTELNRQEENLLVALRLGDLKSDLYKKAQDDIDVLKAAIEANQAVVFKRRQQHEHIRIDMHRLRVLSACLRVGLMEEPTFDQKRAVLQTLGMRFVANLDRSLDLKGTIDDNIVRLAESFVYLLHGPSIIFNRDQPRPVQGYELERIERDVLEDELVEQYECGETQPLMSYMADLASDAERGYPDCPRSESILAIHGPDLSGEEVTAIYRDDHKQRLERLQSRVQGLPERMSANLYTSV